MTKIKLLPSINKSIEDLPEAKRWEMPGRLSVHKLSSELLYIENAQQAEDLVVNLNRHSIGAIAIDTEFGFTKPGLKLPRGNIRYDVRSQTPLLLSGAAWDPDSDNTIRFVFDLRGPDLVKWVDELLRVPTLFVAHNLKAELFTLWSLGLKPVLHQTYDTYVAAKLLSLGYQKQKIDIASNWFDETQEDEDPYYVGTASLAGQCKIYNINHPFIGTKDLLAKSFLDHPQDKPFSSDQIEYSMADADTTLQLYLAQQRDIIANNLGSALYTVEFPFVETNARMEWEGVLIDQDRLIKLRYGLGKATDHHLKRLNQVGLKNPNSSPQCIKWLTRLGFKDKILYKEKPSSRDEVLERIESLHENIPDLRRYRKYKKMSADILFNPDVVGADGRVHPNHRHLGAVSTRSTCSQPNIVGITKTFRPVVVAPEGRALIELDYAQIEVGICAAVYRDPKLIEAFNSGDVYARVAQEFYHNELTDKERNYSPAEFKMNCSERRNKMKIFVLAVLYNMQPQGISDQFGIPLTEAKAKREEFLNCYPSLRDHSKQSVINGRLKGYANIVGGIRRQVSNDYSGTNQLINTPVQGAAAVTFRHAANLLDAHFRGTSTKLVLPIHDAVLFECDKDDVEIVGGEAAQIMIDAVRFYYPELQPRVDINDSDPSCWNKDGRSDSLQEFMENPGFKLE